MPGRLWIAALVVGALSLGSPPRADAEAVVLSREDVQFQPLNPLRGDASPKAGVLWGDLAENVPTGAIVEFAEGLATDGVQWSFRAESHTRALRERVPSLRLLVRWTPEATSRSETRHRRPSDAKARPDACST